MALHELPQDTVRLIKSTQVITTPASIVKELVENSIDAEATAVWIKMENYGFSRLEVRDNGRGICEEDMKVIAKPHYTSKISSFNDLASLTLFGFRGEALSSLCSVADVHITTKTADDSMGHIYSFDHDGNVINKKPAATPTGTTVVVSNLFSSIPVRRQFYNNVKRRREELKKVEDLILAISVAAAPVHLTLSHDKTNLVKKNPAQDIRCALMNMFPVVFKDFVSLSKKVDDMQIEMYLPDQNCCSNQSFSRTTADRLFILVNQRPVTHKSVEKMVKAYYNHKSDGCHGRYPIGVVSLRLPPDEVDVNLEPNKNKVLLKDEELFLETVKDLLTELYGPIEKANKPDGKKTTGHSFDSHTDITCTLASVSQPQHSDDLEKENLLLDGSKAEERAPGPAGKKHHTVTKGPFTFTSKNNKEVLTKHDTVNKSFGTSFEDREGNCNFQSSPLLPTKKVNIKDSCNSADKVVIGKTRQQLDPDHNNKENVLNAKTNVITSTQTSKTDGNFPSMSESCITPDPSFRNELEITDDDLSAFAVDAKFSSDLPNMSGVSPLSDSCRKLHDNVDEGSKVSIGQSAGEDIAGKYNESNVTPELNQSSSHMHESLMGSDGIPIFRIAPLPPSESENEVTSIMAEQNTPPPKQRQDDSFTAHSSLFAKDRTEPPNLDPEESSKMLNKDNTKLEELPRKDGSEHRKDPSPERSSAGSWSRGHTGAGSDIQTVQLLSAPSVKTKAVNGKNSLQGGGKRIRQATSGESGGLQATPPKKPKLNSLGSVGFNYIHGQPVKRPSSAFILFSREIRNEVLSDNPGANFAFIAQEMAARWKALDTEARSHYSNLAKLEEERYQEEVRKIQEKKGLNTSLNSSLNKSRMTKGSLDRYIAPLTPQLIRSEGKSRQIQPLVTQRPWRERKKVVTVMLDRIKEALKKSPEEFDSDMNLKLLCPMAACGGWLCLKNRSITALNTYRLNEKILAHTLATTLKLSPVDLVEPMPFNASILGTSEWNQLLRLNRELVPDRNMYIVTDHRLASNGFKIALYPSTSSTASISHGEIVGLTDAVGYYGMIDFKYILSRLVTSPLAGLEQTRPLKLHHWIQGEAVRMLRSGPNIVKCEDVHQKLNEWQTIQQSLKGEERSTWERQVCIHNKPLFTPVYSLDDLPQSQS